MSVHVVQGGKPTFAGGVLKLNGGLEYDRIHALGIRFSLRREMTGTSPLALVITIARDASQGTASDLLVYKTMFGKKGRTQKSVFPLQVLIVDDVRDGDPAVVGAFRCEKAIVKSIESNGRSQTITFHASNWVYHNFISGKDEPSDKSLVPVVVPGFDEKVDGAKTAS